MIFTLLFFLLFMAQIAIYDFILWYRAYEVPRFTVVVKETHGYLDELWDVVKK